MLGYFQWGDSGWADELARGLLVTLSLAVLSYLFGLVLGLLAVWARSSGIRPCRFAALAYVELGRSVPEIIILFLVYYGGTLLLAKVLTALGVGGQVEFGAFAAGVVALALIAGAFAGEVFRSSLAAVPKGQSEAAAALGLRRPAAFLLVVAPQALKHAVPGLMNLWIMILKDTAIVTIIGLEDLLRFASIAARVTHEPFTFYAVTGGLYLAVTAGSIAIKARIEGANRASAKAGGLAK